MKKETEKESLSNLLIILFSAFPYSTLSLNHSVKSNINNHIDAFANKF